MKVSTSIAKRINQLTSDEDLRQELWVYYLDGNSPDTFAQHLHTLTHKTLELAVINQFEHDLMTQPFSPEILDVLDNFTTIERSVIIMLILDCKMQDISDVHKMSEIHIAQMIYNIKRNTHWNKVRNNESKARV